MGTICWFVFYSTSKESIVIRKSPITIWTLVVSHACTVFCFSSILDTTTLLSIEQIYLSSVFQVTLFTSSLYFVFSQILEFSKLLYKHETPLIIFSRILSVICFLFSVLIGFGSRSHQSMIQVRVGLTSTYYFLSHNCIHIVMLINFPF